MKWRSNLFSKNDAIFDSGESSLVAFAHKKTTADLLVETKYCTDKGKKPFKSYGVCTPFAKGCVGKM